MSPTSGTITYNPVCTVITKSAIRKVGGYSSGDTPRAEQMADAVEALELMFKEWQAEGFLWLKQFVYVTLVASQTSYQIGPSSTDLIHSNSAATTDFLQRPTKIYTPTRLNSAGYEVPLKLISRSDYSALTNKATTGTVVQVYYDAQMNNGVLYVWLTPSTGVTDKIVFTADRIIEDIGADDKTLDVPPEWLNAVIWNLAARIAPEYGIALGERNLLAQEAGALKDRASGTQSENVSTFFQPGI